jgi:hypothetical protein
MSLLGFAGQAVYIGQGRLDDTGLVVRYPQEVYYNGAMRRTDWSVKSILQDFFSSGRPGWAGGGGGIPSDYRNRLSLGSMSLLSRVYNVIPLGDVEFQQATLADALDDIIGRIGTISFREVPDGNGSRLEFFELGDPNASTKRIIVAREGENVSDVGANVQAIGHTEEGGEVRNRVVALGARRKFVVSVFSNGTAGSRLEKAWDTSLEAGVLANPESAKRGEGADAIRTEFSEEKAFVFRRFRLPECLRRLEIDQDNAVELSNGTRLPIQVFTFPRVYTIDGSTGAVTSTAGASPVLLEGVEFDFANGYVTLREPAINIVSSDVDGNGNIADVNEAAIVGVTLTVNGERLKWDSDVRSGSGLDLDGIDTSGLIQPFVNEGFEFRQLTNIGFPVEDLAGNEYTFTAFYYLEGSGWQTYQVGPLVMADDTVDLQNFGQAALRENERVRSPYAVTIPYYSTAYRIGDMISIRGQADYVDDTHQVLSMTWNLGHDHDTVIGTDNGVPMIASQVLGQG